VPFPHGRTRALALLVAALLVVPLAAHAAPKAGLPDAAATGRSIAVTAQGDTGAPAGVEDSRVVVAVIDSGINPFHEFFDVGEDTSVTPAVLAEFGITPAQIIDIPRSGDFAADFDAVRAQFAAIERGTPYWFRGTNIIGISFVGQSTTPLRPDGTASTHGIGVAASVLGANPEAIVVAVEGISSASEAWAFTHPAVDAVSTSYGPPGSPPLGSHLSSSYTGVVDNGKHHFGAVDNSPALSPFDSTGGPWWSIGVSGYQEGSTEGRQVASGSLPDFVGDFTQTLPYCRSCTTGTSTVSGTSFATPTSAGVFSKILLEARRAAGHVGGIITEGVEQPLMVAGDDVALTNWELRRVLEEAAAVPGTAEFSPGGGTFDLTSVPVLPVGSAAQIGWGLLTPDADRGVIDEALVRLGVAEGEARPDKGGETCALMTLNIEFRALYWNSLALFSDSAGEDADAYIGC
jgi:hypothetical protein